MKRSALYILLFSAAIIMMAIYLLWYGFNNFNHNVFFAINFGVAGTVLLISIVLWPLALYEAIVEEGVKND